MIALALAATGFGHRMASASDLERAGFAQLYGDAFCVTEEGGSDPGEAPCPVCQMITSVYVPDAVLGAEAPAFTIAALDFAPGDHLVPPHATVASPPQRGPPQA